MDAIYKIMEYRVLVLSHVELGAVDRMLPKTYKSRVKDAAPRMVLDVADRAWDEDGGTALSSHAASQLYTEISSVAPSSYELVPYFLGGNRREQKIMLLSSIIMVHLIFFSKSVVHLPPEN